MDYQIMTDYLISNTDRHMNNIAIMRNPDTLELFKNDIVERHVRIPLLKELFEKKIVSLQAFQQGRYFWKNHGNYL